jgi:hypothetical protein
MSNDAIVEAEDGKKSKKRAPEGGSSQPLDPEFAKWVRRAFRGGEKPHAIDCYPLYRGRDREQRLYHRDLKNEDLDIEQATDLSNEIFSDCQLHCDNLPRNALSRDGSKTYQVAIVDDSRGGLASPVGTHLLRMTPRVTAPAPTEGDDDSTFNEDDSDALTGRKMMADIFKEVLGRDERGQQAVNAVVGEVMLLQKEHIKDSFEMIRELHKDSRVQMGEMREMIMQIGKRNVEERAVGIDAENAAVEREMKRAQMNKENMWTDVQRAGVLEAIRVVGQLIPGFGQLGMALISGKPIPPPPQLTPANGTNGANGANGASAQPQLPAAGESEKLLVDRFIEAAEKHKIGDFTAAEKLFGKDDEAGKPITPGIFTREQVAILTGVHMAALGVEALDALMIDSGKPEALGVVQMTQAMAYLTPAMINDITRFMELRKAAAAAKKS